MSFHELEHILQAQASESVYLESDSEGRMYIVTPFAYGDGDEPVIVPRKNGSGWILSDEGSTMTRLSYRLSDSEREDPERQRKIAGAMAIGGVNAQDGELFRPVKDSKYSEALFDFVHALLRIDELGYPSPSSPQNDAPLGRKKGRSMPVREFKKSFANLVIEALPYERVSFGWHDPSWDSNGEYAVDCMINGMATPMFLHALGTDTHARDAIITIYRFQEKIVEGRHIAIFRDATKLTKRVRSKLDAVCETRFDNFAEDRLHIREYLLTEAL